MSGLEHTLQEVVTRERLEYILEKIMRSAADGNLKAAAFLFDRTYGKPAGTPRDAPTEADETEERALDLTRLTDEELDTLASLLKKASDTEISPNGHDGRDAGTLSP